MSTVRTSSSHATSARSSKPHPASDAGPTPHAHKAHAAKEEQRDTSTTPSVAQTDTTATPEEAALFLTKLRAMQASRHLRPRLTKEERKSLNAAAKLTPVALIEAVAAASVAHGGVLAGTAFNATAARAAIAQTPVATSIAQWALDFARIVSDDDVRDRAAIATSTRRIYGMLGDYVKTDEGAALLGAYEQMRAVVRNDLRVTTAKNTKAAKAKASTPTPPTPAQGPQKGGATTG